MVWIATLLIWPLAARAIWRERLPNAPILCVRHHFAWIFCLVFLANCASSTNIKFKTVPDQAVVYAKPLGTGALKQIGTTPFAISSSDLMKDAGGVGPVTLEVQKMGYKTMRVYVTEASAVDLNINIDLQPASGLDDPRLVNKYIDQILEIHRLIRAKLNDKALRAIRDLMQKAPQLAALYEFEGGIHYLKAEYKQALDSYQKAIGLNPDSETATKMRDQIVTKLSGGKRGGA